jgi:hypothetical protein
VTPSKPRKPKISPDETQESATPAMIQRWINPQVSGDRVQSLMRQGWALTEPRQHKGDLVLMEIEENRYYTDESK